MTIANTQDIKVDTLDSLTKESATKDWFSIVSPGYEEPLPITRIENEGGFDSSSQDVNGWLPLIIEELYSNPSVEVIFVTIEDDDADVWVVIPERDLAILHQIVETEGKVFQALASTESPTFLIDFHIIYRCGRNIEELAPTKAIRLPR